MGPGFRVALRLAHAQFTLVPSVAQLPQARGDKKRMDPNSEVTRTVIFPSPDPRAQASPDKSGERRL